MTNTLRIAVVASLIFASGCVDDAEPELEPEPEPESLVDHGSLLGMYERHGEPDVIARACAPLDIASGTNPCPADQYCQATLEHPVDGTCQPTRELFDAAVAEYVDRYGDDPNLWTGSASGSVTAEITNQSRVRYFVDLHTTNREVTLYLAVDGTFIHTPKPLLFRWISPGQCVQMGTRSLIVSPPFGRTLESVLAQIEAAQLPHIPLPLQSERIDDSMALLATDELYETEVKEALEARFPSLGLAYNSRYLVPTSSVVTFPLATYE